MVRFIEATRKRVASLFLFQLSLAGVPDCSDLVAGWCRILLCEYIR